MSNAPTSCQRGKAKWIICMAVFVSGVLWLTAAPALAAPAMSITAYKITSDLPPAPPIVLPPPPFPTPGVPSDGPSSFQSGANPAAGSYTKFAYTNGTEDIKTALTNFGPGLLGNPESVSKCSQALLEAGGAACPPDSRIGTSRLDTHIPGLGDGPSFDGVLYNGELLGTEPGRLAAVTPLGGGVVLVSSIPFFITPRGNGDYGLTGILTDISRLDAVPGLGNIQVGGLSFLINASTKYVRNPTSCEVNKSTGQAIGYDDPTPVDGPAYSFATVGCEQIPFAPAVSVTVGDAGSTAFNKFPPLVVKITEPAGQADIMGNKLTLPVELNSNNPAYTTCTQAQADSDTCPAASKFGNVTAKSPFLGDVLKGPVYLLQQSSTSLPGLLLDLQGRVHVKIQTKTSLINGKQIQSLVLNAPQLPVSELTVALNGGRKTGVFLNRHDLCFNGDSTTKFNSVNGFNGFYGWNGKKTADTKFKATVLGCGPAVKGKLRRATSRRPSLTVTATKHPDSPNYKEAIVSLSKNLSLSKSRLDSGGSVTAAAAASITYVNRHSFKVTGLPSAGAGNLTIRLGKGAVRVSNKTKKALKRGKRKTFSVKVKPTPVSGKLSSTRSKFKVKGKR